MEKQYSALDILVMAYEELTEGVVVLEERVS